MWLQRQNDGHTSTELVVGAVAVEVVTLTELAAVSLFWIISFFALARPTNTVSIITADVCPVINAAVCV